MVNRLVARPPSAMPRPEPPQLSTEHPHRAWPASIGLAAVSMAAILALAVGVNLLIPGRVMHWDIVTIMGIVGLIALSLGLRFRLI